MNSFFKYFMVCAIMLVVIVSVSWMGMRQNTNTASVQEVQDILATADFGDMRAYGDANLDKKATVANLVSNIVEKQKKHGQNLKINYVFLDKNNNVTENENDIKSVQFKVQLIDDKGDLKSQAVQRLGLTNKKE